MDALHEMDDAQGNEIDKRNDASNKTIPNRHTDVLGDNQGRFLVCG